MRNNKFKSKITSTYFDWFILAFLGVLWGFSFFFIKKGLVAFSPVQVGSLRIVISFFAVIPFIFLGYWKVPRDKLPYILLIGLLGSGIPPFLFAIAQTRIDSAVTGILNSTTPLFTLFFGALVFGISLNKNHVFGVLIGLAGAIGIILIRHDGNFEFNYAYSLLVILATFLYGVNANFIKRYGQDIHPLNIAVVAFAFVGPFALAFLFTTDYVEVMKTHPKALESMMYLSFLGVFGTAYALVLFNYLTQRTSALFASTVTYLIPIVAVILGVLDGEKLGIIHLLGMILILFGVFLAGKKRREI